ncbi:MAG: Na+/H+ antiporter NhaA [Rhodospirillales bacterium]|nr:Na+/H+ antiporter NhaA [Rhodospirillales bacterium]
MSQIKAFFTKKTAPGILLVLAAIAALLVENSPFRGLYDALKDTPVAVQIGALAIDKPLLLWINDGLMAIFFLLVGLEVKYELLKGHLSRPEKMILPAVAAFGGVAVPALVYTLINYHHGVGLEGWAIPAATDIAFALGVILMLGDRIPKSLRVTLVAIAIIDDIAAILIIALFYTSDLSLLSLTLAGSGVAILAVLNRMKVTNLGPYLLVGIFIWVCVLKSGVHATLAGVVLGMFIPLHSKNKQDKPPLKVLEKAIYPWVYLAILPIFAFVNAGVSLAGVGWESLSHPITLGIMAGLFIGKPVGVMTFTAVAVALGFCRLPQGVTWPQFFGMAVLTGIGFTMSLFIGTLAFTRIDNAESVRIGVLAGSLLSGLAGWGILSRATAGIEKT